MKVMEIMKECGGNVVAKKWDLNTKWRWWQGKGWWWSIKGSAGECGNDQWWCSVQRAGTLMCLKYNGGPKQAMATGRSLMNLTRQAGSECDWDLKNIGSVKSESSDLSHGWLGQITRSDLDSWTAMLTTMTVSKSRSWVASTQIGVNIHVSYILPLYGHVCI